LTQPRFFPYLVLLAGVLVAATSSILIRLAQNEGAPSLVIASWRLTIAALILTPYAWRRRRGELRSLPPKDTFWGIVAGIFLAAHMATWISSLAFTSVASSAALVTTNPLWVTLVVFLLFGERPSRNTVIGLSAAITGSALIAFSDGGVLVVEPAVQFNWHNLTAPVGQADTALFGDGLALVGAVTVSGYLLVGRTLRTRLSTTAYVWLAYSAAMVTLVIVTLLAGVPLFGYPWTAYGWILLLALGPQLLGHTAFNWALAHLSTTFVALSILGEPVGSAIFAYFIFGEAFVPVQLAGFVLLLVGIGLGVLGEQQTQN
jgi:drug/metabolite transporter (DMT)-like permease